MSSSIAIDALIFDLDGTLVDTLDDITDALNRVLGAHGLPRHERERVRAMVGEGAASLIARALPPGAAALTDAVLEAFRRDYFANVLVRSAPYPGVAELLERLGARDVPICVLSNKPHEPACAMVTALFPRIPFRAVVGQRRDRPLKPDPTVALELAAAMRVPPSRCGLVGDSAIDIRTARAAGMPVLAVTWGFCSRSELQAAGADTLIERPAQLLDAFSALAKR